ncbi:hypothetical protein P2G88_01355 [Aliiglaciecola sp. CAU 1673]|uniref:hypothetical protein n=1 Tax=Aliiglaciecola sp. CAU 1673 TaxID=3032595 RepID=UPI0023DBDD37|nr:hypothetical protein [Aliiglaciecola sp. CAU 1673]MDF2176898.1 hypothetical protein [Aliiglaciecola sp. CAU 1673]
MLASPKTLIGVEVSLGEHFASLLGEADSQAAVTLAEHQLSEVLNDRIRYFDFTDENDNSGYRLQFVIDNPAASGQGINIHDYYVFLNLQEQGQPLEPRLTWLFRDAASSLADAESPQSIADSLSWQVRNDKHRLIVSQLLPVVSFTREASLQPLGSKGGWLILHSAKDLCLRPQSKVIVRSEVPGFGFIDDYNAEVKEHENDDKVTFTLATEDVSLLLQDPAHAVVVGVRVLEYRRRCESEQAIAQSSPSSVSFSGDEP